MKLLNVPWDQALDIILKTFSLGKAVENNIIRIAPHTAFAKESEDAAKAEESELKAVPLETKIFPISYADVKDIEKAIKDAKILSSRGSISVDKRTSAVAINDVASGLTKIEGLLATLDKATPQVLIEARIVEAFTSDVRSLGIQWGISTAGDNIVAGGISQGTTTNQGPFTGNNFMVDLPSPEGAAGGIAFGILNSARTKGLELVISALETVGKSKTVSNPRVVTTDNEKATILQGESVPFPKIDVQSGQISAEYKDVAITIEVTPHITPTDSITMSVLVRKEDIKGFVPMGQGVLAPRTDKIEGNTKVLIQDGETLVIGGVFKKKKIEDSTGIPVLMKIPILGWLFKNKSTSEETTELLIFITPRVLEKTI
jgi:type IV pilus assembly protein PilQ